MHRVRISLKPINGLEGSTRTPKYPRNRMTWVHTPQHPHYHENHVHFPTLKIPSFALLLLHTDGDYCLEVYFLL